jgi:hypothetical protein
LNGYIQDASIGNTQLERPIQQKSNPNPFKVLSVNLTLPDDLLIENFRKLLPTLRKEYEICFQKKATKIDLDKLYTYNILPYLDLKIWAQQERISITDEILDEKFLENIGIENFRKTTINFTKRFTHEKSLDVLAAQASFELAEKNKK